MKTFIVQSIKFIGAVAVCAVALLGVFWGGLLMLDFSPGSAFGERGERSIGESDSGSYYCNVMGINLHGDLWTYVPVEGSADDYNEYRYMYGDAASSESIVASIDYANYDDSVKAIILEVDSYGGQPVAGEEIARALKASIKPTVAVIRQTGASAAYWAATGAQRIYASKNSDVGSIGVTSSYVEEVNPDARYIQLSSGKFKDTGDPSKPLTEEERELLMRDIKILHENFVSAVAENRRLPIDDVRAIADGSGVLGEQAKALGLIDEIGGWKEVEAYLTPIIGEKPEICWE